MVSVQNLQFAYGNKSVFRNLSLTLQPGAVYGLLGKNGSGKSTLLKNLAGLLHPTGGRIEVAGEEPCRRQPVFLRDVFVVPEEFYLPDIPIGEYVKHTAPFYPLFDQARFANYLALFSIPGDSTLQNMSYGQKKKVLISFALASGARLLLMDEPTNGLDIIAKGQFRRVLAETLDDQKCIVVSTHQVKDLENLIDRITVLEGGEILFDQSMATIGTLLRFQRSEDGESFDGAFYSEPAVGGALHVVPSYGGEESRIDLELLYKAIVSAPDALRNHFANAQNIAA